MRMMLKVSLPGEKANAAIKDGSLVTKIQRAAAQMDLEIPGLVSVCQTMEIGIRLWGSFLEGL